MTPDEARALDRGIRDEFMSSSVDIIDFVSSTITVSTLNNHKSLSTFPSHGVLGFWGFGIWGGEVTQFFVFLNIFLYLG